MGDLTKTFYRTARHHFLTLSCVQYVPSEDKEYIHVFSGFLIEINDNWFYVTAGHIIRSVQKAISSGSTFDVWRLDDQTAGNSFGGNAIPYDFEINNWLLVEDEETGIDYAATPLVGIYRLNIKKGGAFPITEGAWGDHLTDHDYWALVGIPSETVEYDGKSVIKGRVVLIPLVPTKAPEGAKRKSKNRFFAKIKDIGDIKNIDGMSGGPVFALIKSDNEWRYCVIGVQSSWYKNIQTVAVCSFSSFGATLRKIVERIDSSHCV